MAAQQQSNGETGFEREFVRLEDLRTKVCGNKYLSKTVSEVNIVENFAVPHYPTPVEFRVSEIAHVTTKTSIDKILESPGFRVPKEKESQPFSWWSLDITDEKINEAATRYMSTTYPGLRMRENFLQQFTTSPVFLPTSRYGNFKFTLPLAELMDMYRKQICGGAEPVLRTYKTVLFKQQIMYAVLIHSPELHQYDHYPLLGNGPDDLCTYSDGVITWRAQAIAETHSCRLVVDDEVYTEKTHTEFYVWDSVTLAFHLEKNQTLFVPKKRLIEVITACAYGQPKHKPESEYVSLHEAKKKTDDIKSQLVE